MDHQPVYELYHAQERSHCKIHAASCGIGRQKEVVYLLCHVLLTLSLAQRTQLTRSVSPSPLLPSQVRDYRSSAPSCPPKPKEAPLKPSGKSKADEKGGKDSKKGGKKGDGGKAGAAAAKAAAEAEAAAAAAAAAAKGGKNETTGVVGDFGVIDGPPRDVSFVVLRPTSESVARDVVTMAGEEDWSYEEMLVRGRRSGGRGGQGRGGEGREGEERGWEASTQTGRLGGREGGGEGGRREGWRGG